MKSWKQMIFNVKTIKTLIQGSVIFSLEVQIVNILGFLDYMVSDAMTQFYHYSVKASIENRL